MNNNTNTKPEFKLIYNKTFADTIEWMTGERYYRFTKDNREVYSFKYTDKFQTAYQVITATKAKLSGK